MPACEIVLRACRLSVAGYSKYPATLTPGPGIEGRQLGTNRQHERLDSDRPVGAYPPGGGVGVDQLRVRTLAGAALSGSLPLSAHWQRPQPEPDSEAAAP